MFNFSILVVLLLPVVVLKVVSLLLRGKATKG